MFKFYSQLTLAVGFGMISLSSIVLAKETVSNKPGAAAPKSTSTAQASPSQKLCSEKLTTEMAIELEELNQNWKASVSLCQSKEQTSTPAQLETIKNYNAFIKRSQPSLSRSHKLYGEHLIAKGLSELTDAKAAADEKYTQSLQTASNLHLRNKELFCAERLFKLKHDLLSIPDEAALCKKLEKILADKAAPEDRSQDKIQATSIKPSRVILNDEAQPIGDAPASEWRPPTYLSGGGSAPLLNQSGEFSSLSDPGDRANIKAQEFSVPGKDTPMEDFFSESLRKSRERALARSTSECLSQNSQSATQTYWTLRSRMKAAASSCQSQAGIDWQANWKQFSSSNPVTGFKPQLPAGMTEKEFEQEQVRLAQQRINEQRRICENENFQRDFQEAVRMNSAQIEDQIAESICEIKTE